VENRPDPFVQRAEKWLGPFRKRPLNAGLICPNLHRLPEFGKTVGMESNSAQLAFLKDRNRILFDLIESGHPVDEVEKIIPQLVFAPFFRLVKSWDQAVAEFASAFCDGNYFSDNVGEDIWLAPGVFAVNFWKE
jgi:hypothetical protein